MGFGVVNVTWVPPLKSMPRFKPWIAIARTLRTTATTEMMNHRRRWPTTSIRCQRGISCAVAPMKRGLSNHLKPASSPSIARVANTAVTSESTVPMSSIKANPLTPAVATVKRMNAVIHVTAFASRIVCKPFA